MRAALKEAFEPYDDFENAYAGTVLGKPGDGGYLFREAVTASNGDVLRVSFEGGYYLLIEGLGSFGVARNGFSILDARVVTLGSVSEVLTIATADACEWPDHPELRIERLSDALPIWECRFLGHVPGL
jgi:hypothetical protein